MTPCQPDQITMRAVLVTGPTDMQCTEFPLYFGIEIQGLSRTLKLHFQRPIHDRSLQHGQYYSNI